MGRFYVTTPIYYVNDVPHLGTAYTTIVADALRRYHQLIGDETFLLTGTDEHGQKIERQAAEAGMDPKTFCDGISARFREAWPKLDVVYDRFIRTTDEDHERFVVDLWKKIEQKGDLYEAEYEDWYCVGCEGFKTEKELEQPGNLCPLHKKPVEKVKEKTFFFRLEKYQERLLALYEKHPKFIRPETRKNEVVSFVQAGLRDLSCSRTSFKWGIPVPNHPEHVMYVWFDALSNYRSALGAGELARFWPSKGDPDAKVVHLVGKDILRFHTVFWPAFLLSAGYTEEELPQVVYAHGFLTVDGLKMGKALRNAVDPLKIAAELGSDVLRYQLLRAIAFGQDGDFDHEAMLERYNADLGKNLGNLLSRVLGLCAKLTGGKHPADEGPHAEIDVEFEKQAKACAQNARTLWNDIAPNLALEETWRLSSAANAYIDKAAPWAEAKNPPRANTILSLLLRALESLSVMIWPAMPKKSDVMRAQLGLAPLTPAVASDLWPTGLANARAGLALAPSGPLFPVYDPDTRAALLAKLAPPKPAPEAAAPAAKPAEAPKAPAPVDGEPPPPIDYAHFAGVDLRVGVVKTCEKVPKKDKLLRLTVDLGEATPRTIVAGLALSFTAETLVGRRVVVVANLAPREFGTADFGKGKEKLVSHGMLLATGPSEALNLATVDGDVAPGARLK